MHAQRDVGVLGGVGGGAFDIDLVEGDLLGALAAQVFIGDGVEAPGGGCTAGRGRGPCRTR